MVLFLPPPFPPPPPQATLRDPQGAKKIETHLDSSPLLSSCIQMTDSRLPHRPSLTWGSIPREGGRHICSMLWGSWLGSLPASSQIQSEASIFLVGFKPRMVRRSDPKQAKLEGRLFMFSPDCMGAALRTQWAMLRAALGSHEGGMLRASSSSSAALCSESEQVRNVYHKCATIPSVTC